MPTRKEIEELKRNWESDPCWDLYKTEGFERHYDELKVYQEKCEKEWEEKRSQEEKLLDQQADDLGIRGLYRLLMKHQELLNGHARAIELLVEGKSHRAYRVLIGYEE